MKIIVGFLVVAVLALAAAVVWLTVREPLTASEVAKAIGMHYWRYQVPSTYQPSEVMCLEVTTPEGVRHTGGAAGFRPGEHVKLYMTPIGDGSQFRWSILGQQANITSMLDNPFKGLDTAYWPDGSLLKNDLVMIGNNGSLSLQQPKASDTVIRIKVRDPSKEP